MVFSLKLAFGELVFVYCVYDGGHFWGNWT